MIFTFACACGHTWQGRKALAALGRCVGCNAPITEAMEAAAVPLGVESDGPNEPSDPRAPELSVFGIHIADSREIDALRDLRALVLRTEATRLEFPAGGAAARGATPGEWGHVVKAAQAAMTPATFDPQRSRSTVFPTEEHACSHCHMVTHARVGMGPPAVCPGCGR